MSSSDEPKNPSSTPPEEPKKPSSTLPEEFKKLPKLNKPSWVLPNRTQNVQTLYRLEKKLGEGTTFLCEERATGTLYVCKTIPKKKFTCKEDYDDVRREIQIMQHLSGHPNVVRIQGTYEEEWFVHIVMEHCAGGEVFDRIVKKGQYSEREAAKLMKTIVGVVEACHSLGVMHRDLKPENFLFTNDGDDATLKTIDFGLAVFFKPGETFTNVVGSPFYLAPEVLGKSYGPEADVWSAGVILYTLLSGAPPFWAETDTGIFREILQGKLDLESEPWSVISDSAKDLIRKMLDRDPSTRLTAHQVLRHPWIIDDSLAPDKPLDSAVLYSLKHFFVMNKLKKMSSSVEPSSAQPDEPREPSSAPPEDPTEPHTLEFRKPSSGLPEEFKKLPKLKKPSWVLPNRTQNVQAVYIIGKKLGEGQFGTTFLCTERATGTLYACKTIPKKKLIRKADYDNVRREIQIMQHLSGQPNVVRIQGTYEEEWYVHIVMELCAGGQLFDRIQKKGHYSEREAAKLMKTIVGVVEACHSLGVMHRDLKPENFLFTNDGEDATLKSETFSNVVGSPYYVAPEVLRKSYGPKADVWSTGVILYILLSGVPPFYAETDTGIYREVLQAKLDLESEPWPGISDSAKDLIRKMLDRDPSMRLTAHQVLRHPWIIDDSLAPDKLLDSVVLSRLKQFSGMNKLKKMALYVIAKRLSEEEIGGLKELFQKLDTDGSGTITFEELKEGLRKVGCDLMESEIKDLMEAVDIDNSGTIDYGEFLAATMHLNKLEQEENLVLAFSFFDKDGSGYITIDEIQQACKQFGLSELNLDEMIKLDQDNDGKIDYSEFVAMMRKGNGGIGRRTMRNTLNLAEALAIEENKESV